MGATGAPKKGARQLAPPLKGNNSSDSGGGGPKDTSGAGLEADEKIDIAARTEVFPQDRTEQRQLRYLPALAEPLQPPLRECNFHLHHATSITLSAIHYFPIGVQPAAAGEGLQAGEAGFGKPEAEVRDRKRPQAGG